MAGCTCGTRFAAKAGKEHTLGAPRGKVAQAVVGGSWVELVAQGRVRARELAARITGGAMEGQLFEPLPQWHAPVAVRTDQVRLERARSFGAVWLGWILWRSLGLDRLCEGLLAPAREEVPWAVMAAVLVVARLCEPPSELHIAEHWYQHTALEDLRPAKVQRRPAVSGAGSVVAAQGRAPTASARAWANCLRWIMTCCFTTSPALISKARRR